MRRFSSVPTFGVFSGLILVLAALVLRAEGPLLVGGPDYVEGVPFRWSPASFPLTYWTDRGMLGNQTNAQADSLVSQAFQTWRDVPTASITFSAAGELGSDVTASNYMAFANDLYDCGKPIGPIAKERSIVYDVDGSIVRDVIGDDPSSLLGFATPVCYTSNGSENIYTRGLALLNGRWIDGINTFSNPDVSLAEFKAVFIHEFGHLLGLDHSQINIQDYRNLPTMFPLLFGVDQATLAVDDIAGISELYPETTNNPPTQVPFLFTTGRIRGRIFFSDGVTPVQGLNVIARRVDDPSRVAVSSVSGFLFTADNGNPIVPYPGLSPSPFGSRDQALIGYYEIPGLSLGNYTIVAESISPDFVLGSSVGPVGAIGFQFPMPGYCSGEFANVTPPESDTDACADQSTFSVTAGAITDSGTDIILNGTFHPRFDAWEDE